MSEKLAQLAKEGEKLLEEAEEKLHLKRKKKPFYQKAWFWLMVIFFGILIILAIGYFRYWLPFRTILQNSNLAQTYFLRAQKELLAADFRSASLSLEKARLSLDKTEKGIHELGAIAQLGPWQKQYLALEAITLAGQNLSSGLQTVTNLSAKILDPLQGPPVRKFSDITSQERRQILESIYQAAPEIQGAKAELELAQTQLDNISLQGLHPLISNYVKNLESKLDQIHKMLLRAATLSRVVPSLLGYPNQRTYLFLLQNNDELRPTGGFIGTLGVLKIKDGKIESFQTDNVYELDKSAEGILKISLPRAMSKFISVNYWYLRDSNWSPDFPTSANRAQEFFDQESRLSGSLFRPENFDGVVAITPNVIEDFLKLTGAVEVKNFVFNADNFTERLEYLVEIGYRNIGEDYSRRKNIIGILSSELVNRFERMQLAEWINLIAILEQNLNQKQILIHISDPLLQNDVEAQNWAGKINSAPLDYLVWIDANLAALKTDQYIKRQLTYQIYPDKKGDLIARASMAYENTGAFTWKSTRYRTYARLYVPLGSELIKTSGSMQTDGSSLAYETDVSEELGKTVFGAFISIEPGEKGVLSFEYKLPDYIKQILADGHYSLLAQKQAGTQAHEFYLDLNFADKITSAYPAEEKGEWGDKKYCLLTDLEVDREFKVNF